MKYLSPKELDFVVINWGYFENAIRKDFEALDNAGRYVEGYEFDLFTKGKSVLYIDNEKYTFTPGSACLRKPGQHNQAESSNYECYTIWFMVYKSGTGEPVDGLDKYSCFLDEIPTLTKPKNDADLIQQLMLIKSKFIENTERDELKRNIIASNILLMMYDILEKNNEYSGPYHPAVKKAIKYFYANADTPYSMEDVANYVGLEVKYFQKLFKKYTGKTPNNYSLEIRLNYAKEKLVSTDWPIYEIALYSGFTSVNYFNRVFKKFYNQTPTEYRNNPN